MAPIALDALLGYKGTPEAGKQVRVPRQSSRKIGSRAKAAAEPEAEKPRVVAIRYADPDQVPLDYANNFYINHTEHEFIMALAAVVPPPVLHMTPSDLENLDHVDARVLSRTAMSPGRFREFLLGAVDNYNKWARTHGQDSDQIEAAK